MNNKSLPSLQTRRTGSLMVKMSSMLVADCWLGKVDGVAAARGILAQGCKLVIVKCEHALSCTDSHCES